MYSQNSNASMSKKILADHLQKLKEKDKNLGEELKTLHRNILELELQAIRNECTNDSVDNQLISATTEMNAVANIFEEMFGNLNNRIAESENVQIRLSQHLFRFNEFISGTIQHLNELPEIYSLETIGAQMRGLNKKSAAILERKTITQQSIMLIKKELESHKKKIVEDERELRKNTENTKKSIENYNLQRIDLLSEIKKEEECGLQQSLKNELDDLMKNIDIDDKFDDEDDNIN